MVSGQQPPPSCISALVSAAFLASGLKRLIDSGTSQSSGLEIGLKYGVCPPETDHVTSTTRGSERMPMRISMCSSAAATIERFLARKRFARHGRTRAPNPGVASRRHGGVLDIRLCVSLGEDAAFVLELLTRTNSRYVLPRGALSSPAQADAARVTPVFI